MNKYSKYEIITAVQRYYGYTKKQAEKYFRKAEKETLIIITDTFKNNARKAFYQD